MRKIILLLLMSILLYSCTPIAKYKYKDSRGVTHWERFDDDYNVGDTVGIDASGYPIVLLEKKNN